MNKTEANSNLSLLDNNVFKKLVFVVLMVTTFIINLGYIQTRESSKADFSFL